MAHYRATYKGFLEGEYGSAEEARKDFETVINLSDYPKQLIIIEKYDAETDTWMPLPAEREKEWPRLSKNFIKERMNSKSEKEKSQ